MYPRYTRFSQEYYSGYEYIDIQPLRIGDTYGLMGSSSPTVIISSIEVTEYIPSSKKFQITIICNKSFERINNELVLLNKEIKQNITMFNFFEFFDRLHVYKEINFLYIHESELLPKYQEEIKELKSKVANLEAKLKEKNQTIDKLQDKISKNEYALSNTKYLEEKIKSEEKVVRNQLSEAEIRENERRDLQYRLEADRERADENYRKRHGIKWGCW